MSPILDAWCALCDHLAPFALVAVVPLLLWVHHFETHSLAVDHVVDGDPMVDDLSTGYAIDLFPGAGEKGVGSTDTLKRRWAA